VVLDTSAIVAIHLKEPGHERLIEAIEGAQLVLVGTPTMLEAAMVLSARLGQDARPLLSAFVRHLRAEVVPFHEDHADAAIAAFLRFGRGRHPAGLNFGDCMSYSVAAVAGMPLLFTGSDFARTDIPRA
jgi:ribonuclease VapC